MKTPRFSLSEIIPCFFAIFIDILGFGLVYPVLTAMFTSPDVQIIPLGSSEELRFWYLSIGFLLYPFFMLFGSSFMGDLSDIMGRKKVLMICMGGLSIGFIVMGLGVTLSSLSLLFIGRGFCGLMGASMSIALAAVSDLSTEQNKAVHMSFVALIQSLGFVLGPLMGGFLSDPSILPFFNYSVPFYTSAILAFIALLWVIISFQETFIPLKGSKIRPLRIIEIFADAIRHRAVRVLMLSFLLMQMGIALYIQLILIFYKQAFNYSSLKMGLFNAYLGFWFGIGLILIVPYVSKRFKIEKVALTNLIIAAIFEFFGAIFSNELVLWLAAIPLAIAVQVGFTSMLASFSNAVEPNAQGWVMGLGGSMVALSFFITGLSPNLVPILGSKTLIFFGSILMFLAFLGMWFYCKRVLKTSS